MSLLGGDANINAGVEEYPSGEMEFEKFGFWKKVGVKVKTLFAPPCRRMKKGSVLTMTLKGQISDQLRSRFSSKLSLPRLCENLTKAAYDPRILGIYLQIEPLSCGWAKIDEIRRHILHFRKSGKFTLTYIPICGEKEYYLACACEEIYLPPSASVFLYGFSVRKSFVGGVFEKLGIEPQVQRIGKYKSLGDQISRKNASEENREVMTSLLDNVYQNWLKTISSARGKETSEIEDFINSGVYQVKRLKEEGWITDVFYDDEIISMLKERTGVKNDKNLRTVDYKRYSGVRNGTVGLAGGKDKIAIIRACGLIRRYSGPLDISSGIFAEKLIKTIRKLRDSKKYKAVIIRIDSSGGDGLASDLIWREIKLLAASKPVIASMSDVAASGGYYMAMATEAIVAEKLTLTGSIGVFTAKFNLENLYDKIGFNKEILSRGQYAELHGGLLQRTFRPEEAELYAKQVQDFYELFRERAASSRSMTVDQIEVVAQGRVWTGEDAASKGLVDAIGGLSRAIAIAKQKAKIPQNRRVTLVEFSRRGSWRDLLIRILSCSPVGVNTAIGEALHELRSAEGIQARADGILLESCSGSSQSVIDSLIRGILNSI